MSLSPKQILLSNGIVHEYVEQGDPSGIPVLFLHGYTDSWRSFEPILPYLPRSIRALALTQRGHGDSERPATGYRPDDFASDAVAFLDALGIESAVVAGHSMGSIIARRVAERWPERVLGVVLMAAFHVFESNPAVDEVRDAVLSFGDTVDPGFVREFQLETTARPVPESLVDTYVAESLKVPARVWKEALRGIVEADDSDDLERISAPTLIVWGDRDTFCGRSHQDALLAGIPGSELLVYPGAGHAFHWEDPAEFVADLTAFVQTVVEAEAGVLS